MREKEIVENYIQISKEEIENFMDKIDSDALTKAKDMILHAEANGNRVHISGIGKPSHVAQYVASLLSSTGTPTYVLDASEAIHGSSGQVVANDVVIAISNSGETDELKATVQTLKQNGALLIAVTGNVDSWLANTCDVCLFAGVQREGDTLNKPPRSSIIAEILVLQSLSILLQEHKQLTSSEYGKWHPGGSLGKQIREENK